MVELNLKNNIYRNIQIVNTILLFNLEIQDKNLSYL